MTVKVALSRAHFPVTTLGPGRRLGIWFQGCSVRCAGCISMDTWDTRRPDVEVAELVSTLQEWLMECDGVTISGGEPFDQPQALEELVKRIRELTGRPILVYSGHNYEAIQSHPVVERALVDAVISEPFELSNPQTLALRGSDNQRLHLLTDAGRREFGEYEQAPRQVGKHLDVMFDVDGSVWFAGIPQRGDMRKLQEILSEQGVNATVSEGRR